MDSKIENLLGLLATAAIAAALFFIAMREPQRLVSAQEAQIQAGLEEAMTLYAENCSVCHGLSGEGLGAIPALDTAALRDSDYNSLFKVISRGLFGTAMPAWSKEDGGPLSDFQVGELVTLLQDGDWQETRDRVINLGLAPAVPIAGEPDPDILSQIESLPEGETLKRGVVLYAQHCIACHGEDGLGSSLAPALNDPLVRAKPAEDLRSTILNGVPGTLMASWDSALPDQDLEALVRLVQQWDQVPSGAIPAPDQPLLVTEESLAQGADLYAQNCARCHGPEGQGTPRAPSLNVKGFLADTSDAALLQIITMGVPGTSMPSWGDRLNEAEIQALVGFIRSWEPDAPEVAEPARGGGPWWQTGGSTGSGQGKGPPWLRNSDTSSSQLTPGGGSTFGGSGLLQQGQPSAANSGHAQGEAQGWGRAGTGFWATIRDNFDLRMLALPGTILAAGLMMIALALRGLKLHPPQHASPIPESAGSERKPT